MRAHRPVPVRRNHDDSGFTLVELAIVVLVMGILFAITMPIVSTILQTSSKVDVTYENVDEQLWLSTTLQRLVRSAVAPTPSTTAQTVPAFVTSSITPTSMTFYTNTGTVRGPEKVIASCTATPVKTTRCDDPTSTFTVTITKAELHPSTVSTPTHTKTYCPQTAATTSKHCKWTTTNTKRRLVTITHVKNGSKTPLQPLFVYAYGTQPTPGDPVKTTTVCAAAGTPSGCSSTDAATFDSCLTGTPTQPFENCRSGEVRTVDYDLQINNKTTVRYGGAQAEDDTGIFLLSATSMLYDPTVG